MARCRRRPVAVWCSVPREPGARCGRRRLERNYTDWVAVVLSSPVVRSSSEMAALVLWQINHGITWLFLLLATSLLKYSVPSLVPSVYHCSFGDRDHRRSAFVLLIVMVIVPAAATKYVCTATATALHCTKKHVTSNDVSPF